MNIVFVLPQLKTGGGVRVIIELANILVKTDKVSIVLPNSDNQCSFFIDEKVQIIKVGKTASSKIQKIKNMLKVPLYVKNNFAHDCIIVTDPIQSLLFLPFSFKKIFRYIQADDYRIFDDMMLLKNRLFLNIYKFLTKLSYQKEMKYFFNSTYSYEQFKKLHKKEITKEIVHPSLNHKNFYPQKRVSSEKLNIALITRKHPIKRFQDFIDAYKMLEHSSKIKIENVFIITQDNLDGFELFDFKVIHPKDDKEIASILNKSDIFVFCSLWEGFGLPPLEAMACGCGVITSDAKGVNEYAKDSFNCMIYPPKDISRLKDSLESLINNHDFLNKIQKNAILTAEKFSWENSAKQLKNILKRCDG